MDRDDSKDTFDVNLGQLCAWTEFQDCSNDLFYTSGIIAIIETVVFWGGEVKDEPPLSWGVFLWYLLVLMPRC